ncbi:YlbF family regulator [Ethanoligenens sp.]|uniref:YlbF family regulator n=1 Tax=Ethanoligenens sp. TaxID=2099655 RepID=UPI0039E8E616
MDAIEKAKELIETITQDPRCVRLQAARAAVETDWGLQGKIRAWNVRKATLTESIKQPPEDRSELMEMQKKLAADYDELMAYPLMTELHTAQNELNELLMQINNMIQRAVSGEVDCSGGCDHCSGCH